MSSVSGLTTTCMDSARKSPQQSSQLAIVPIGHQFEIKITPNSTHHEHLFPNTGKCRASSSSLTGIPILNHSPLLNPYPSPTLWSDLTTAFLLSEEFVGFPTPLEIGTSRLNTFL